MTNATAIVCSRNGSGSSVSKHLTFGERRRRLIDASCSSCFYYVTRKNLLIREKTKEISMHAQANIHVPWKSWRLVSRWRVMIASQDTWWTSSHDHLAEDHRRRLLMSSLGRTSRLNEQLFLTVWRRMSIEWMTRIHWPRRWSCPYSDRKLWSDYRAKDPLCLKG